MARTSRNQVNERCYQSITTQLTDNARAQIDELLNNRRRESYSVWQILKREPQKPTNKAVRSYLQHVHWLQSLGEVMPALDLPAVKLKQFALEARALDVKEMVELKLNKRYALAVILIRSQHSKALDDVAELFIRLIRKIENSAKTQLQTYLLEQQKQVDSLIHRFKNVLTAYQNDDCPTGRLTALEDVMGDEAEQLIGQCDEHIAYAGNNYLPFMLKPYRQKRTLLFNCLNILDLQSTTNDKTTEALLKLIRALHINRHEYLKPEYLQSQMGAGFDPKWMPDKWRKLVLIKEKNAQGFDFIHRKYLELSMLSHIQQELSSADLYIPHSDQFDDYREQLADDETLARELSDYGKQVELPIDDPKAFTKHLKTWLTDVSRAVDQSFPDNVYTDIHDGRLALRKQKRQMPSDDLENIDKKSHANCTRPVLSIF